MPRVDLHGSRSGALRKRLAVHPLYEAMQAADPVEIGQWIDENARTLPQMRELLKTLATAIALQAQRHRTSGDR